MNRDELELQEQRWEEWKRSFLAGEQRRKQWDGAARLIELRGEQ